MNVRIKFYLCNCKLPLKSYVIIQFTSNSIATTYTVFIIKQVNYF